MACAAEVAARVASLEAEHAELAEKHFDANPSAFAPHVFSLHEFKRAFAVVLSRVIYLPAVDVLALVGRTPRMDYSLKKEYPSN